MNTKVPFVLLAAVNVAQQQKSRYSVSILTLSMFLKLLKATYVMQQYQGKTTWQQWLRESPTVIRYTYIAYLDKFRGVNTGKTLCLRLP
jgi:hypothetical protein